MATTAERVEIVIVAKDEASQALRGISSSIGDVGKIAAGILSAQVLRDLANGFINVGKASINAAAQIETNRTALKTLLGSEQEASKMIKELQELARMTPFSFDSAVTGAKRLMAMGVATEDVQKNLKLIGNAVAAIGGTSDVFDRMIYNLGQVQAQGRATTMDLRQFAMAGIPIYDALSESMGVSSSLLSKMVEEGKIGYAQLTSALQHYYGEGGKFGNMMLEQSQTFSGVMANIKDSFQITLAAFAEDSGLFQAVKDIAGAFLLKMDELAPKLNEVALAIKPLIEEAALYAQTLIDSFAGFLTYIVDTFIPAAKQEMGKGGTFELILQEFHDSLELNLGPSATSFFKILDENIRMLAGGMSFENESLVRACQILVEIMVGVVYFAFGFVKTRVEDLLNALGALADFIKKPFDLKSIENLAIALWNVILPINAIKQAAQQAQDAISKLGFSPAPTKKQQFGGVGGGVTLVGETGPEMVKLPYGSHVYSSEQTKLMGDSGGGVVVNFNGDLMLDSESRIDQLVEKIELALGNNTNLGLRGV